MKRLIGNIQPSRITNPSLTKDFFRMKKKTPHMEVLIYSEDQSKAILSHLHKSTHSGTFRYSLSRIKAMLYVGFSLFLPSFWGFCSCTQSPVQTAFPVGHCWLAAWPVPVCTGFCSAFCDEHGLPPSFSCDTPPP